MLSNVSPRIIKHEAKLRKYKIIQYNVFIKTEYTWY